MVYFLREGCYWNDVLGNYIGICVCMRSLKCIFICFYLIFYIIMYRYFNDL